MTAKLRSILALLGGLVGGCLPPRSMSDGASGNWIGRWTERIKSPMSLEDSLVYQPRRFPDGDWSLDAGLEEADFESADGTRLHGWFASPEQPNAVVLFLHGTTGNVTYFRNHIRLFNERLNCAVFAFDYRGYGRSRGRPSESGIVEDARAARSWLANRCGVPEADVILVGHSLGGGVAVEVAARDGARGLVLWNTFTSLPDVAKRLVPLLPVQTLMRNRLDSWSRIGEYRGPLLQSHGDADLVIPFEQGERLHAKANEPKRFVPVHGGGHNDPPSPEFLQALREFLQPGP